MHISIPTIGIEKFFEYHSKIRMSTIDVALSADLNDRGGGGWRYILGGWGWVDICYGRVEVGGGG